MPIETTSQIAQTEDGTNLFIQPTYVSNVCQSLRDDERAMAERNYFLSDQCLIGIEENVLYKRVCCVPENINS